MYIEQEQIRGKNKVKILVTETVFLPQHLQAFDTYFILGCVAVSQKLGSTLSSVLLLAFKKVETESS